MRPTTLPNGIWFMVGVAYSVAVVFAVDVYLTSQGYAFRKSGTTAIGGVWSDPLTGWTVVNIKGSTLSAQSDGYPVRLNIPDIHVDSSVEFVGLADDGTVGVPKERASVAWYQLGPRPGESGSAVIVGHYGIQNNKGSAFDNLHKLRIGDTIFVENDRGETLTFVVRESRRYDPKADAQEVFRSTDGKPHLNLITCEGVWDIRANQYPTRLVVFTDQVLPTS